MIASLETAFVLLHFVRDHPECGLSEIARATAVNKSRAYRMLTDLCTLGYLQQNVHNNGYRLGVQSLLLGQAARSQHDLITLALPEIDALATRFDENVQLRIRDGEDGVQIFARKSRQELQVRSQAGNRRQLGLGASGKLLLAYAPLDIITALLPHLPYSELVLQDIRQQGYATSQAELTVGVYAIAAPIFSSDGSCHAALSISLPSIRANEPLITTIRDAVIKAAARISVQYSGNPQYLTQTHGKEGAS